MTLEESHLTSTTTTTIDAADTETFLAAIKSKNIDAIASLITSAPMIVHHRSKSGRTGLHLAAETGDWEICEALIRNGAPWNAVDEDGVSAGEIAKKSGFEELYSLLKDEGVRSELILGMLDRRVDAEEVDDEFLKQKLHYSEDGTVLFDEDNNGVMMDWETPLMIEHVKTMIKGESGKDVLNVGFGLGIVDSLIQNTKPRNHFIIEAHPDVYAHMLEKGWDQLPGVTILYGKWQEVVEDLYNSGTNFDCIFFDTFGETYDALRDFHDHVPNLLKNEESVYSWFNGLGGTNTFFHDVYCDIARLELLDMGVRCEYIEVDVEALSEEVWKGVKRPYFTLRTYRLPLCCLDV